jgi:excisionase family DNA binding protein
MTGQGAQRPRSSGDVRERPTSNVERLWTAEDLAERWQVPTSQVYRLTREDRLPVVRVGRYYRYSPAAIVEVERSGGVSGC